jgi:hypothetical protein
VDRPIFFLDHVTQLLACPKQANSSFMLDVSYEPSSDSPGTSWCLSQQHQEVYNECKRERHAEWQYQDTQKKRQKLGSPLIKQESLSPCPTPRPTAVVASERFAEYYSYIKQIPRITLYLFVIS